ncbi:hypothetical protein [Streptomyces sp. SID2119]|uniref:hypothetical protein n=1 Tax=Streptomyces sp. SID2119 TaxID=2690253 RepID=UPI00136A0451|nr:hypothetical protein [Streptomyces sp. SID2119]MYW31776.1 hypothetical protein [Streptomyces sp. SID2119]
MQSRRTRLTATAAGAVIGLFLASGCAPAQNQKSATEAPPATEAPSAAPSAKASVAPLTVARLKSLALKIGEVPQAREPLDVQEPLPEGSGRSFPPVSVPACRPLIDVRQGKMSSAQVFQLFNWKKNIMGGSSSLASYEDGQAERRFAELKRSLATCRHYEGEGFVGPYRATVTTEAPPEFGEEAVSFREIIPMGPKAGDRNEQFVVVRTGNTIATFTELSIGKDLFFPPELITRQVERLRNAQRS